MERITFLKPVIDSKSTGSKIKSIRQEKGFSVRDIQSIFGFEYPQAVYAWEQGKNIPTIDNLLVLSELFNVKIDEMIVCRKVEIEVICSDETASKLCKKSCDSCKWKLSA